MNSEMLRVNGQAHQGLPRGPRKETHNRSMPPPTQARHGDSGMICPQEVIEGEDLPFKRAAVPDRVRLVLLCEGSIREGSMANKGEDITVSGSLVAFIFQKTVTEEFSGGLDRTKKLYIKWRHSVNNKNACAKKNVRGTTQLRLEERLTYYV
jgi:hypothetical protein